MGILFQGAGVDFELSETDSRLRIARLDTEGEDELPIPVDEDVDREEDPLDHCDNSLLDLEVNDYGCRGDGKLAVGNTSKCSF